MMADSRIKVAKGPTILLSSGHQFDLLDPAGSRFTTGDIAAGLSKMCRFAGQCDRFYSVAEHCWHTSFLVPDHLKLAALMHDASEAFIGDVTRPLKSLLPEYKVIEQRIEQVFADRFGLHLTEADEAAIKRADMMMLAAEQAAMMPRHDDRWPILEGIPVPEINFRHWGPPRAAWAWIERFELLANLLPAFNVEGLPQPATGLPIWIGIDLASGEDMP